MTKAMRNPAIVATLVAVVVLAAQAGAEPRPVVVLHIINSANAPSLELRFSMETASQIYRQAGIEIAWMEGSRTADQPGAHFEVLLLSREKMDSKCEADGVASSVFGTAARPTGRAFVFYPRIAEFTARTKSSTARLLGTIIAHEVGHLLLPPDSHSPKGVMRARWNGPLITLPRFTPEQARAIQARLAATDAIAH